MRSEIAFVSPSRHALTTCGTKLPTVHRPAAAPRTVIHHAPTSGRRSELVVGRARPGLARPPAQLQDQDRPAEQQAEDVEDDQRRAAEREPVGEPQDEAQVAQDVHAGGDRPGVALAPDLEYLGDEGGGRAAARDHAHGRGQPALHVAPGMRIGGETGDRRKKWVTKRAAQGWARAQVITAGRGSTSVSYAQVLAPTRLGRVTIPTTTGRQPARASGGTCLQRA